jgi:hypothetical protein
MLRGSAFQLLYAFACCLGFICLRLVTLHSAGQLTTGAGGPASKGSDAVSSCLAAAAAAATAGLAASAQQGLQFAQHHDSQQEQQQQQQQQQVQGRHEVQLPAPPDSADAGESSTAAAADAAATAAAGLDADLTCLKQEYLHVSDLAAAFVAALGTASNPPAVYNVGTGRAYSQQDVWTACHKVFGIRLQVGLTCRNLQESS